MARIIAFILTLCFTFSASAQQADAYHLWLQNLEQEAIAQGISAPIVSQALGGATLLERVVELDRHQPESSISFARYSKQVLNPQRIKLGKKLAARHRELLEKISAQYGVPVEMILALWGVESSYGIATGGFNVLDALVTLAYEGRRVDFFRAELFNALRIIDEGQIAADQLRGSWAGAMGQCQFMPSTYLKHAVDYDGDGVRDIWHSQADVFASIANYLVAEGWQARQVWGREVGLKKPIPTNKIGLEYKQSLAEWTRSGVSTKSGKPLPNKDIMASLIQPDGAHGRSFLVYDNFRALLRWNRSTYFATSVGLLSDRLNP